MYGIKSARYTFLFLLFTIGISFLNSCSEEQDIKPENLIPEETYIDLLVELQLLRSYSYTDPTFNEDSVTAVIFQNYGVSSEDFFISHDFYQTRVEDQIERVSAAIERIKKEQALETDGDSLPTYRDTLPY